MHKMFKKMLALTMVGIMSIGFTVFADNISDIEDEKEDIQEKMEEAQAVVDQLASEQDNIMQAINELDAKVAEYSEQIDVIEEEKSKLEDEIVIVKGEVDDAKAEVDTQYDAMKKRIQYEYENGEIEYIDTLFTTTDVSDMVNQSEYIDQIYKYDSKMLDDLIEAQTTLANKEAILQGDIDALTDYEEEIRANQEAVEVMLEGKQEQVQMYTESISEYEDKVAEYQAAVNELDNQIAAIEAELEEKRRQEAEQLAAELGGDPSIYMDTAPTTLRWPVASGGQITSYFGPRWGRMHEGLDIGCALNSDIVACEDGVIVDAGWHRAMGNYIMIDHGGGMTTVYMHNNVLIGYVGQEVVRGQVIALAGTTGFSTGVHCHVGVRINGSYVNPLNYMSQ